MGAPDIKYTDRDLRENAYLYREVCNYLRRYQGEFQFLVDAKMALEMDDTGVDVLPIGVARGVLNCMRVDPRVAGNLPAPLPPSEAEVVPMRRPQQRAARRSRTYTDNPCNMVGITEHDRHSMTTEDNYNTCPGWWKINRAFQVVMPATVKAPCAMARSGKLIHAIGDEKAEMVWLANTHEWGWDTILDGDFPTINVKVACKYPSYINKAVLLTREQALAQVQMNLRKFCQHCYPKES